MFSKIFTRSTSSSRHVKVSSKKHAAPIEKLEVTLSMVEDDRNAQGESAAAATEEEEMRQAVEKGEVKLAKEVKEVKSTLTSNIKTKEEELKRWKAVLEKYRVKVDEDIKKWQSTLDEATKVRQTKIDKAMIQWQQILNEATTKQQDKYEDKIRAWKIKSDEANTTDQFKTLMKEWNKLEESRHTPSKEMQQAQKMIRQLDEYASIDTKEMKQAKKMIARLEHAQNPTAENMTSRSSINTKLLSTKKEEKYVQEVMKWEKFLEDATAQHTKAYQKWMETLNSEAQVLEGKKSVSRMLTRLVATHDIPSEDMKKASDELERLDGGVKDGHMIMIKYAGSKVCELEDVHGRLIEAIKKLDEAGGEFASTAVSSQGTMKQRGFLHGVLTNVFCGA